MRRRNFLLGSLAGLTCVPLVSVFARGIRGGSPVSRIAFGSCADQNAPQPIWDAIAAQRPDLFVFLGDNIYGDTDDMGELHQKYIKFGRRSDFKKFRDTVPIIGTWDDHDYGRDESGAEYPFKEDSKTLFLEFFKEPPISPRWWRDGIYTSYFYGDAPKRLQVILLDLRWFQSRKQGLLGEVQWRWLEKQLSEPADLRVIGSSIQFAARGHQWEKWDNYPKDRSRFLRLIDRMNLNNLFFISGDMHFGELSQVRTPQGRVIYDLTSSGLNRGESAEGIENTNRVLLYDRGNNFGFLEIDWARRIVQMEVKDQFGNSQLAHNFQILTR